MTQIALRCNGFDPKLFEDDGQSSNGDLTRVRFAVIPLFDRQIAGDLEVENQRFKLSAALIQRFGGRHAATLVFWQRLVQAQHQRGVVQLMLHFGNRQPYVNVALPLRTVVFEFNDQLTHSGDPLEQQSGFAF